MGEVRTLLHFSRILWWLISWVTTCKNRLQCSFWSGIQQRSSTWRVTEWPVIFTTFGYLLEATRATMLSKTSIDPFVCLGCSACLFYVQDMEPKPRLSDRFHSNWLWDYRSLMNLEVEVTSAWLINSEVSGNHSELNWTELNWTEVKYSFRRGNDHLARQDPYRAIMI